MIAKVYYLVGTACMDYVEYLGGYNVYIFPSRIFSADEEPQAKREYERLAKRNFEDISGYAEAYMVKIIGEDKTVVYGNKAKIEPYI